MSPIIAGRFQTVADAEAAARKLYARGLSEADVSIISTVKSASSGASGVMLAVCASKGQEDLVTDVLRESGAAGIEYAQGEWESGRWKNLDPAAPGQHPQPDQGDSWLFPVAGEAVDVDSTGNEDPGSELEHFVERTSRG